MVLPMPMAIFILELHCNKSLKDFIVKSKTMAGFDSPYVPGWDCHGLPIEIKVDQQLGGKKLQMQPMDVIRKALSQVRRKIPQFPAARAVQTARRLRRFEVPYSTMEHAVQVGSIGHVLCVL